MKATFLVGLIVLVAMLGANADDINCHTECKDGVCNMVCARGKREMAPMDENVRQKRGNINCSQKCEGSVCNTICAEVGRRKRDVDGDQMICIGEICAIQRGRKQRDLTAQNEEFPVDNEKNGTAKRDINCSMKCTGMYCSRVCIGDDQGGQMISQVSQRANGGGNLGVAEQQICINGQCYGQSVGPNGTSSFYGQRNQQRHRAVRSMELARGVYINDIKLAAMSPGCTITYCFDRCHGQWFENPC